MEWTAIVGILVVLAVIVWLVVIIISANRDSKLITVDSEFSLRLLPPGQPLPLTEGWVDDNEEGTSKHWEVFTSRELSQVDARIAYESYQLIRAHAFDQLPLSDYVRSLLHPEEVNLYLAQYAPNVLLEYGAVTETQLVQQMANRSKFTTLSEFIKHVAFFDSTLSERLKARVVDPHEYELDPSGWYDDEDDD